MEIRATERQVEAWELLQGKATSVLLDGGARSGKSFIIIVALLDRAQKFPGSRHLVARYRLAHAKTSIWHETMLPLIRGQAGWTVHPGELYAQHANGSEIWLGGFDDPVRIDKILGHEYVTIYCNEISQISYEAFVMARSRLAQKIPGAVNKIFLDCNPPSPQHWAHRIFFEGIEPRSRKPLEGRDSYAELSMNPSHNAEHLPPDYITRILGQLPDAERRRFRDGEWVKPEGMVFSHFDDSMICEPEEVPPIKEFSEFTWGIDFGLNPAAVLVGWMGDHVWLIDDWGGFNVTTSAMNLELHAKWNQYQPHNSSFCDPSGGERIQEIECGDKADNSVEDGIDWLNTRMERGEFHVSRACTGWLGEVYDYHRNEKGGIVKHLDHAMDSCRYATFSRAGLGVSLYV